MGVRGSGGREALMKRWGLGGILALLIAGAALGQQAGPLDAALGRARVDGKYRMLLRQIAAPSDADRYGELNDWGYWAGTSWAGHDDLPPGHWVYVAPSWYIWRDLASETPLDRSWGPEQATGAPNTPEAGDIPSAWASLARDESDEWLMLEYEAPVEPTAIEVHETFNPGAVVKVTAFRLDGEEVVLWTGRSEPPQAEGRRVNTFKIPEPVRTNRIKLYLASNDVPGWNEIDAVALVDGAGRKQWATSAAASSTFAEPAGPTSLDPLQERLRRLKELLDRLERELQELKTSLHKP
jgi:hypothetical protein